MEESILIGEVDEDGKIVLDETHARYHKFSYLNCFLQEKKVLDTQVILMVVVNVEGRQKSMQLLFESEK